MDAKSVYLTVTMIILANGGMLSAINRDFPVSLRPAAMNWMWATLVVAAGCVTFAVGGWLPRTLSVLVANSCLFAGLCLYYRAIRTFQNLGGNLFPWLVFGLGMAVFLYFLAIVPDTLARIVVVSVVWIWLMAASIRLLADKRHRDGSRSRIMLISLYCAALVLTALRALFYIATEAGAQLDIADNSNWMNTITPVFLAILPIIGTTAFILMCTDQVRRRWERVASKDYLTGLPNRRTLNDVGTERFERVRHLPVPHVVAVLDIDDFKRINDNHGHEVGDQVLKHLAACLQASMQADDFVARSGGEEFVIIFGERNSELPLIATEAIRRTIAESPFVVGENALPVTVSIGVAQKRATSSSFESLLRKADRALYQAKSNGKNRVEIAAQSSEAKPESG